MDRPIKVLHVVTRLELGGAQGNTLYTFQHLNPDRFTAVLACGRGGLLDGAAVQTGGQVRFLRWLVRPIRPLRDLLALRELIRLVRTERPDIVHTHSSKAGVLGRLAARRAGTPVVVHTFHGFGFHPGQNPIVRRLFICLERWLARRTTVLIAVSRANVRQALAMGIGRESQFRLIRSGVPLADYRAVVHSADSPPGLSFEPGDRVIMTVGPFKPQKNLADFVRAAAQVAARWPAARFLVVGDGAGRPALEKDIRRLGLAGRVTLAGWRRDIPALLARADIFCMTSLWEGLPRSLVEAMAAGLPCVVNDVDGCADVVRDGVNGYLVPPRQFPITAERLLRLLADPALARRMGDRARTDIGPEFDIDGMVRDQERLYGELFT